MIQSTDHLQVGTWNSKSIPRSA